MSKNDYKIKKTKSNLILLLSFFIFLQLFIIPIFAQTYENPVIAGDFPDPSVIRVGEDYYATATSGGWSPLFPILHSKDLINWKVVGAVFQQKPSWAKGDFWAPEIAEDNGKFYVFYTARRDEGKNKKGTLCVAVAVAENPFGVWTDKGALVCQEMGSIDAFFVRDEKNKPFLVWKEDGNDRQQPTWLYAQELDESLTKLKGKPKQLFRNEGSGWENHVIEGADVVRHNEYFYLFYSGNACCGRSCNYALGVARSKSLLGKWEKNPNNPILAANENWQCPGHGTIVKTPNGEDFLLYHSYRKRADAFNIGREALLDKIEWTSDGWATINGGRGASKTANVPLVGTTQENNKVFIDEFSEINPSYQIPLFANENLNLQNGFLNIKANDLNEAVVAIRSVSGNYSAQTLIRSVANETVGLKGYSWRNRSIGIIFNGQKVSVIRREGDKEEITAAADVQNSDIYLQMKVKEGEFYQFAYSLDGKNWVNLGKQVSGSYIEGARVALTHSGAGQSAKFDWFKIIQD